MGSGISSSKKNNPPNSNPVLSSPPTQPVPLNVQPIQQQQQQLQPTVSPRRSIRQSQQEVQQQPHQQQQQQSPRSHYSSKGNNEDHESDNSSLPNEQEEENLRMHFAQSAMSLGMDNDDLIFNLLYFGDNSMSFQSMFNSAIEETVAAHSAGNTPYKLKPASVEALDLLKVTIMTHDTKVDQNECSICQEDLEIGQEIIFLPICSHSFHNECLQRWFRLQSWCPICRTEILTPTDSNGGGVSSHHHKQSNGWKTNLNTAFEENDDHGDDVDDDDEEIDYHDETRGDKRGQVYYLEGRNDIYGEEDEEEEEKSAYYRSLEDNEEEYQEAEEEEEEEEKSYRMKTSPSIESLMAKHAIDSIMENALSPPRR